MQLLVDIEEQKVEFVLELLSNFKFVKTQAISKEKYEILESLTLATQEVNLIKLGKKNGKNIKDLINEL